MRDVTKWSDLLPRNVRDRWACLFLALNLPLIYGLQFFYVLPNVYSNTDSKFAQVLSSYVVFIFCCFQFYSNFYQLITVDASGRQSHLPVVLKPNFRYCYSCQLNAPPRSYHCQVCGECILKQDHHSFFSGCCIGLKNHRFFFVSLVYLWLSVVFALFNQWTFFWKILGGLNFQTVVSILLPQFATILGFLSIGQFFIAVAQISVLALFLASSFVLIFQFFLICRGQTWREFSDNEPHIYDYGVRNNISIVLSRNWLLPFIWPFCYKNYAADFDGVRFPEPNFPSSNFKNL